jgi:hypothetical protein
MPAAAAAAVAVATSELLTLTTAVDELLKQLFDLLCVDCAGV